MLSWRTNTEKALVTVQKIVTLTGPIDPADLAKIVYIAEKQHINDWGRPIYGETFLAYPAGPIPSCINNMITGNIHFYANKIEISKIITLENNEIKVDLSQIPYYGCYSMSDHSAIENAIMLVMSGDSSNIRHYYRDAAWRRTQMTTVMDGAGMISDDTPDRDEVIEELKFTAQHSVF